jgi:hypothetical protein
MEVPLQVRLLLLLLLPHVAVSPACGGWRRLHAHAQMHCPGGSLRRRLLRRCGRPASAKAWNGGTDRLHDEM